MNERIEEEEKTNAHQTQNQIKQIHYQPITPSHTHSIHITMDTQLIINQITWSFFSRTLISRLSFVSVLLPTFWCITTHTLSISIIRFLSKNYIKAPSHRMCVSMYVWICAVEHIIACFENKNQKKNIRKKRNVYQDTDISKIENKSQ